MKDWAICNALGSSPIADGSGVDWADWGALPDELLELQPDLSSTAEEAGQLPDVDLLIALTETEGALLDEPLLPIPSSIGDRTEQMFSDAEDIIARELVVSSGSTPHLIPSPIDDETELYDSLPFIVGEQPLVDAEDLLDALYGSQPGPLPSIDEGDERATGDTGAFQGERYETQPGPSSTVDEEEQFSDANDIMDELYRSSIPADVAQWADDIERLLASMEDSHPIDNAQAGGAAEARPIPWRPWIDVDTSGKKF